MLKSRNCQERSTSLVTRALLPAEVRVGVELDQGK